MKTFSLDQAADICLEMFELYTEPYAYALMSGELPAITYLVHRTASKDRDWTATIRLKNSLTISIFRCEIYIADILYLCRRCKMYLQTPRSIPHGGIILYASCITSNTTHGFFYQYG